jgi:hypothetical protein
VIIESLHGKILGQIWVYKPLELVVTNYCEKQLARGAAIIYNGCKRKLCDVKLLLVFNLKALLSGA